MTPMTSTPGTSWIDAAAAGLTPGLALAAIVSIVVIALGVQVLRRLAPAPSAVPADPAAAREGLFHDTRATATIEFALVFPLLLFFGLLLTQTTMLMGAQSFVHYAAFAATRSAIVQVPADYPDNGPNAYTHAEGRRKYEHIRAAAVFALVPAAGRTESGSASPASEQFVDGLRRHYAAYGREDPNWIVSMAAEKVRYAAEHTEIDMLRTEIAADGRVSYDELAYGETVTFEPRDPITVRVRHRLVLPVPYVNRLIADGELDDRTTYTLVSARYTLSNEGVVDELPPPPGLQRVP